MLIIQPQPSKRKMSHARVYVVYVYVCMCVCVCVSVCRCIFVFSFLTSLQHYHTRWFNLLFLSYSGKYYIFSLSPYFCSCWPIIGRGCVNLTINQTHNKFVGRRFSFPFILFFFVQNLCGDKKKSFLGFLSQKTKYIYMIA